MRDHSGEATVRSPALPAPFQFTRPTALLATIALGVLLIACGEPSPEAQLAEAEAQLAGARTEQDRSRARLEEREGALERAQAAVDEAREALDAADERVRQAEAEVAVHATDDVLFRTIQKLLLEDPALADVAIAATVRDGIVTLRGEAETGERDRAVELAGSILGVRQVVDEIRLPQPTLEAEEQVEEQAS